MTGKPGNEGAGAASPADLEPNSSGKAARPKKSKRGQSGLSLLVAVNKPQGMTSHDVVNAARRVFGERRVGHTGTLDPLATGVLPVCIGPATRLDNYLTGHDKRYRVRIAFGYETDTDDSEGERTVSAEVPAQVEDEPFATSFVSSLVGEHEQMPPRYSAVKVNGVKSYEAARKGSDVALASRRIEVLDARLLGLGRLDDGCCFWDVDFLVSKGTYIRSLARDIGRMLGTAAHVGALHRSATGFIDETQAVSLQTLEQLKEQAAIDPVAALGLRYAFADDLEKLVCSGSPLRGSKLELNDPVGADALAHCECTGSVVRSVAAPNDEEKVCVIVRNRLKALYSYSQEGDVWKPACVFSTGVARN